MSDIKEQLQEIRNRAIAELGEQAGGEQIEAVRVRVLGRAGELTNILRRMREVPQEERPLIGQLINECKRELEQRIDEMQSRLARAAIERSLREDSVDVTLPGIRLTRGRLHPVTLTIERMLDILAGMGFEVIDTRDIEDDFHNFAALNFPPDHPARDMQDSFFLPGGLLLRTHTSNGQIRVMERRQPPLAVVCPGLCFRRDEPSVRAMPSFSQIEGFMVDRRGVITMAHLKGVLIEFARQFYGADIEPRFRSSFFPFVEPGCELDIACTLCSGAGCRVCKFSGWIEVLGAGMIHPNVLRAVNYDPEVYQGFAFGMGVDRTALRLLGVEDMRLFVENDLRFLNQF